jgi:hypothetical protein
MSDILLRWNGPFALVPSADCPEIYGVKEAKVSGVYIWALPLDGSYIVNYVGVATESVATRQDDHMRLFLSGKYTIYNPDEFAQARKVVIYDPRQGLTAFLSQHIALSGALMKLVKCIHLFFAPVVAEKVVLERIESSFIEVLRGAGGRAAEFLDNVRISRWIPNEQRVSVAVVCPPVFEGMPNELHV